MKTLKLFRYLLLITLGATLFFSCSDEEFEGDELGTFEETTIDTRDSKSIDIFNPDGDGVSNMAPDCEIEICATITPNTTNTYPDIYIVDLGPAGQITIQNGIVTLLDGSTEPLVGGVFCADIPIYGSATATLKFKGYGAVVTTGEWPDGTVCELFSAGVGTTSGISLSEEVTLECDPPCAPPIPDCIVEVCANITPNTTNSYPDIYIVDLGPAGQITIQNGIVTLLDGSTEPLVGGQFCANIPIFGSTTATLKFKGYGAVVTTGKWPDGTKCELFSAGVGTTAGISLSEEVTLTCDPPCCNIKICAEITPNTTNSYPDIYRVTLPDGGIVKIQNGFVTLPSGATFPLVGNTFCADIEVPVGSSVTANLAFKGYGAVVTKGIWPDGSSCLLFTAGVGTTSGVSLNQNVTIECDPPC